MKAPALIILFLLAASKVPGQVSEPFTTGTEQQLENNTATNADRETEDDAYQQRLQHWIKVPLNLNDAEEDDLKNLQGVSPMQIRQLISYRNLLGPLISIYELQAVPLWDIELIQKIRPYITVSINNKMSNILSQRFTKGDYSLLVRVTQIPERAKGYDRDTSATANYYPGSPQKILLRFQYNYKHLLQYGLVAEKDAGEQFFKGQQKQGFDFYSYYFFISKLGIIRSLAIGDFVVNMGQGLQQWQSLAFKKSADVMNIKREAPFLLPYHSAGEINFHRGVGITLQKKKWQAGFFASYKKIDANGVMDTFLHSVDHVSSLQNSGYHRTKSESDDKGIQRQLTLGANLSYQYRQLHLGVNAIWYQFKLPLIRPDDPYNKFALPGKSFGNYSIDYGYTHKNFHLFGEIAFTGKMDMALVNGLLISVSPEVDISFLYRHISKSYRSLYSSAFTEAAEPNNESGIYAGITVRPNPYWRIDAYADIYQSNWLKYRVDKPSAGTDFLIQATYKPGKKWEIYSRYRIETKGINNNPDALTLSPVELQPRQNWRTNIRYRLNQAFTLRSRIDLVWFDKYGVSAEEGFLTYFDLFYKPELKPLSASIRVQYFETNGYNSRIYAYENDVLYNFSIPGFYEKGFRYYININYDINKRISLWLKWAQTLNKDKTVIGSGLDEIKGNIKSEARLQFIYRF